MGNEDYYLFLLECEGGAMTGYLVIMDKGGYYSCLLIKVRFKLMRKRHVKSVMRLS